MCILANLDRDVIKRDTLKRPGSDFIRQNKFLLFLSYFLEWRENLFPLNKENEAERFRKSASKLTHATSATGIFNFGISEELPKH